MTVFQVKRFVRERDGRCTACGMTNAESKERYGRSLDVHRLVPGSKYTVEGCVCRYKRCHGRESIFPETIPVMISKVLFASASGKSAELLQRVSQYVNDALRMRLEAEGCWPPKSIEE